MTADEPGATAPRWRRGQIRRGAAWLGGALLLVLAASTAHALWGIHRLQAGTLVIERPRVHGGDPIRIVVGPANPNWTPLSRVAPFLKEAVVTAEDDLFWTHHGFNRQQIRRSLEENLEEGHIVRGGSTLSMQLARNLFLSPERTWVRKIREAYLTVWIELLLDKRQILEAYLNVAEWGPDLYGVGPAARRYFGKVPRRLSLRESVLLAIMLPAPKRYARYATETTEWSRSMVNDLLRRMRRRGVITQEQYLSACYGCPVPPPAGESPGEADSTLGPGPLLPRP